MLVGLVLLVVVAFFAWQWWSAAGRKMSGIGRKTGSMASLVGTTNASSIGSGIEPAPLTTTPPKEEKLPDVAGQSEADLRAKEPLQSRAPVVSEMPVTPENLGPPTIPDTLRHPEQSFHQPAARAPNMSASDVPSGRAGVPQVAAGGAQMFAPEMAQNGGPIIGDSVFAFDGMEPTLFANF